MEISIVRTYQNMSLSLPPKLVRQISTHAKQDGKTKSEFIREALRMYMEIKELRKAQGAFSKKALGLGVENESGVEDFVDDVRAERARGKK